MATCRNCGKKLTMFNKSGFSDKDICADCWDNEIQAKIQEQNKLLDGWSAEIEAVILTTETYPQDIRILERVEIVTAECAFGMNIFKDLFAGVRDIVGGRSEAVQKTMRDARRTVLYELKKEAHEVGANAVVGVDLDYVELSAAGSMVMLVASGTAVKVEQA